MQYERVNPTEATNVMLFKKNAHNGFERRLINGQKLSDAGFKSGDFILLDYITNESETGLIAKHSRRFPIKYAYDGLDSSVDDRTYDILIDKESTVDELKQAIVIEQTILNPDQDALNADEMEIVGGGHILPNGLLSPYGIVKGSKVMFRVTKPHEKRQGVSRKLKF